MSEELERVEKIPTETEEVPTPEDPPEDTSVVDELIGRSSLKLIQGPYITAGGSTAKVMTHVMVALLPSLCMAGFIFGGNALILTGLCAITAMGVERIWDLIYKRKSSISDLSAAVTGILLAYTLPVTCPFYVAMAGAAVAICCKQAFGGLGRNLLNPALMGRLVLDLVFSKHLAEWVEPFWDPMDAMTTATPMEMGYVSYYDLFMGNIGGAIGEVSKLAILLGAFYLLAMRAADLSGSFVYIATVMVWSFVAGADPLYQVMSGGLLLAAVFMCSDPVTTPATPLGKLIFGLGAGALTCLMRANLNWTGSVTAAVLVMDLLTPGIDIITRRRVLVK